MSGSLSLQRLRVEIVAFCSRGGRAAAGHVTRFLINSEQENTAGCLKRRSRDDGDRSRQVKTLLYQDYFLSFVFKSVNPLIKQISASDLLLLSSLWGYVSFFLRVLIKVGGK